MSEHAKINDNGILKWATKESYTNTISKRQITVKNLRIEYKSSYNIKDTAVNSRCADRIALHA